MRTALVTGGGKGIGAAIARRLANDGFRAVVCYRTSKTEAERLVEELNAVTQAVAIQCDVTDTKQVEALRDAAQARFGHIDTVVNNAGVALYKLLQDTNDCEYERVMRTNCDGAFKITRAFLPDMISQGFGRIVNISSMWGEVGSAMETVYSMSKAAVLGLTKALAKEVGSCNITVNAVTPGAIQTDMLQDFSQDELADIVDRTPLGRLGTPQDVANAVSYLVQDDLFLTGATIKVNGGMCI